MNPELSDDINFESKGFMETVSITDFPIRETIRSFSGYAAEDRLICARARDSEYPYILMLWPKEYVTSRNLELFKRDVWRRPCDLPYV